MKSVLEAADAIFLIEDLSRPLAKSLNPLRCQCILSTTNTNGKRGKNS